MKLFKLIVHQKNFSGEDLIINPKDYPGIKTGDVVEIYHPEDEFSRLLLQVTSFKEDLQGRETISVENNVATMFQLRTFADVHMNIVNPDDVALDSVELTFKDQYMGRSEMWRLKNSLVNTCVYINKKIEFCGGSIRCQVHEMWSQGDRVACGVITDDTKVVFRSSTSMVYLFIQMSSEMWDFDIHGDLYFEKAVNGFLADLFQKWKKNGSNHEVTIVLFSRTFYNASSLEEFPNHMRECLQHDYRGRFYEDFYRVAVQNERYEDWSNVLVQLRKLFTDYQKIVLEYHQRSGITVPTATNSTAAQGNFLEVLNMSLNVFEKHYLDRSFDRTGQLSVVITPGVGVFEVDRELTNVTKQRVIDNGVGSDLVCVGEQPLHAVPLLKFHNKDKSINVPDDYSMPHWINLSFYSTNKKIPYSTFIPRIKLPPKVPKHQNENEKLLSKPKLLQEDARDCLHNTLFDYDAYDAQVFQLPPIHTSSLQRVSTRTKKTSVACIETPNNAQALKLLKRKMSDPDIHHPPPEHPPKTLPSKSAAISIPHRSENTNSVDSNDEMSKAISRVSLKSDATDSEISPPFRPVVGSAGSPTNSIAPPITVIRPSRALINPFDPSHVTIKLTSNRRRWTHIFPKGPTGVLIQQHHYQAVPAQTRSGQQGDTNSLLSISPSENGSAKNFSISRSTSQVGFQDHLLTKHQKPVVPQGSIEKSGQSGTNSTNKSLTLLWGATGEQEWTPALTTGLIVNLSSSQNKHSAIQIIFQSALKYWRFRVFLLPLHNQATRRILEGSPRCDIYKPLASSEQGAYMDGFLRFIEGWLNKIRRPNPNKNWSPTALGGAPTRDPASHLTRRRHSTSLIFLTNHQTSLVGSSPFRERLGSNRLPEKPRPRSGSKVLDRGRVSPASEAVLPLSLEQQQDHLDTSEESNNAEVTKIKSSASNSEILEALKHPLSGVGFFTQHPSLPSQTFVSADAVQWLNNHIDGGVTVESAVGIMQGMINERLICHASGDFSKPFILGFYLYHIVQEKESQKAPDYTPPLGDLQSFENEWVEIETRAPKGWCERTASTILSNVSSPIAIPSCDTVDESNVPIFLRDDIDIIDSNDEGDCRVPPYKHTHLDIDINNKSDRIEWGHLRYQSVFKADHSYELVVQWVASSGNIVADLIFLWQRKAQMCGIHMVPIPSDLLALPFTLKSDPLRGPIFIPLDTECLMNKRRYLFEEFREDTYTRRLFLLQEAILQRFGFLPCMIESIENTESDRQYVHVTGIAFILVPSNTGIRPRPRTGTNVVRRTNGQKRYPVHSDQPSPHEAYITRHVSGKSNDDYSLDRRMGFLWSWNHMVSRKWKSLSTSSGDELFQKRMIQDFRQFCSNGDNRLKQFWETCWELKEKSCIKMKEL
ncbi:GATOR complex protein Iml1 [Belonocnema kinseyi]|uniref:GATOR complex protein Iml1 n=1 Tax=Belonocnema kinseyi TaxID=2817044 RepID=UPI00143CEB65|nr:GATOR complex protein Iml1 [Belonocnema kinseyi]